MGLDQPISFEGDQQVRRRFVDRLSLARRFQQGQRRTLPNRVALLSGRQRSNYSELRIT